MHVNLITECLGGSINCIATSGTDSSYMNLWQRRCMVMLLVYWTWPIDEPENESLLGQMFSVIHSARHTSCNTSIKCYSMNSM